MVWAKIEVDGLEAAIHDDGWITVRTPDEGKTLKSDEWIRFINKVNTEIAGLKADKATIIDTPKFRISVNADPREGWYRNAISPPWRSQPFRGDYHVNIEYKATWNKPCFALERPDWEHIVKGYFRYRDSVEWQQKRNREINQEREKFGRFDFTASPYKAVYNRAQLGKRSKSRCRFDWQPETGKLLVYLYHWQTGNRVSAYAFDGPEFEAIIVAVEARLLMTAGVPSIQKA